jgi:hypothetical protein
MKIDETTKISALIKHNPNVIDAIASISKNFEKFKNPILRKILASRVTIQQAAKIGDSTVEIFFEKLVPLGFEVKITHALKGDADAGITEKKDVSLDFKSIEELDVRQMLKSGKDPFHPIMDALKTLDENSALKIVNTFEPTPLITILSKKGYTHHTVMIENQLVHTYFFKPTGNSVPVIIETNPKDDDITVLLNLYKNKVKEITVTHLEMPQPMVTILSELETLPEDHLLFVHHKKVPQFLFPQLSEKGYLWRILEEASGEVKLLIFKHA